VADRLIQGVELLTRQTQQRELVAFQVVRSDGRAPEVLAVFA
jgi:hypothetical protein